MVFKISKMHARMQKAIMDRLGHGKRQKVEAVNSVAQDIETQDNDPKRKPMKRVVFMSRSAVSRYMFGTDDILISISDSDIGPPALAFHPREVLALAFNDHVTASEVKELGWRQMDAADGKKVVEFVLKHENSPNVVVHCNVGESRSKGAALAIAEITGRSAFHVSDRGNITKHERAQYDFFNRRVYELILMEHMRLDC